MRMITIAALASLSLSAHAVEYTPNTDVAFDIIQMHDTTTWEKVCQSYDGVCDVPEGTYQVKLLDRNWNELVTLRDVSVQHSSSQDPSGGDGVHAPDLTAELCALYQVLDDQSLLGSLSVPTFCFSQNSVIDANNYPAVLALSDDFVSAGYLGLYYDIDRSLIGFLRSADLVDDVTVDCPEGGSASGSTSLFTFDVVFDRCVVDGVTLSGGLARDSNFMVFGQGDSQSVEVTFNGLRIEAGKAGTLDVTGTYRRADASRANATPVCGSVIVTRQIDNRIDAARIVDEAGVVTTVSEAFWTQRTEEGLRQTNAGPPPCTAFETLTFDGAATVESTRFGAGTATLGKRGDIVRVASEAYASSASARIEVAFGDGSTLAVTLTSDADEEVQVDILADGEAVSFTATYRFDAREDIPPAP